MLRDKFIKRGYVNVPKNSLRFNKFLFNKIVFCSKGLFCRFFTIQYFMLGRKGGDYAYTGKLYNFIVFKNRKRRKCGLISIFF